MRFFFPSLVCAAVCVSTLLTTSTMTLAQDATAPPVFREVETTYLFGFTTGSDIGLEGEKEVSFETVGNIGKRAGDYRALLHKLEFEYTPTQFLQIELAALATSLRIDNTPGMENRNGSNFAGLSAEIRYLLVGRGPGSPFGLTVSFEPEWGRLSHSSGDPETSFAGEMKLQADTELIPNRFYAAANLIYEPEVARARGTTVWERESSWGVSGALAYRFTPSLTLGAELGHFRTYAAGLLFKTFEGQATYLGPTLYMQLTKKTFIQAAWSTQIAGHSADEPERALDLANFARHKFKIKAAMEF